MDAEVFFGLQVAVHGAEALPRVPRAAKERADFLEILTDAEFKRHFRFSKNTVVDIVSMLEPDLVQDPRGDPLTPVQQVCAALCHYGGGHYQRITGLGSGVSQYAARAAMIRVTDALISRKAQFISMPDIQEMQETSQKMLDRFGLPRFAMAVDGMMARFEEAPRKLPAGKHQQQYWCRKQFFAINCQVIANEKRILDLDISWPGSTHDSRIWNRSQAKIYIESQRRFLVAGDSGYPISEVLIKPYSNNEADGDRRKRIFNRKLSGARTVMSENIYGVWKRRFPIIKALRTDFRLSQKIICATAILFNLGRMWSDDDDDDDLESDDDSDQDDGDEDFVVVDNDRNTSRIRGNVERERLLAVMRMQ